MLLVAFLAPASWAGAVCTLGCTMRFSMVAMAVIVAALGLLVFINRNGGINPVSMLTMAITFIVIFLGLWVAPLHWLYDASIIVGTLVGMLVYFALMAATDKSFLEQKKAEHAAAAGK